MDLRFAQRVLFCFWMGFLASGPALFSREEACYNEHTSHIVIALPQGVTFTHSVDERNRQVAFAFSGLSVVQLQAHCLQHALNNEHSRVPAEVTSSGEGALLLLDLSLYDKPTVTVMACHEPAQLIIGVHDQSAPSFAYSDFGENVLYRV